MVEAGGKRLRPAFCHWGFVGAGGDPDDQRVVDAGAAFELMHAFALFHDDVMDDASSRRGEPTTHAVYADTHRLAGWSGESRRFGEGAAILVGDLAFVLADELLVGASDPVWRMWNELRTELNIGQFLDIVGSVRGERRIDKAERIARYKSGKYTIERPLHLGALLAAPDRADELLPQLSRYGLPLGDAFQMRDDVMGVFGDTARHRQAGGWRPARGQADAVARPRRRRGDAGPARRARSGRRRRPRRRRRRRDPAGDRRHRRPRRAGGGDRAPQRRGDRRPRDDRHHRRSPATSSPSSPTTSSAAPGSALRSPAHAIALVVAARRRGRRSRRRGRVLQGRRPAGRADAPADRHVVDDVDDRRHGDDAAAVLRGAVAATR